MKSGRRVGLFVAMVALVATACGPLNRTAAHQRAARDSVYMPLDFSTPDSFVVAFETTRGRFDVMAHSDWAPVGTDRFYELVHRHFYDSVVVFRVIKGFVAQFGISGNPKVSEAWRSRRLADEPVKQSNTRGRLAFARGGPGTRTTQLYINYGNNVRLDTSGTFGFPAFAEVVKGMEVVDSLYAEYGAAPQARQGDISRNGNGPILKDFPKLDIIKTARIIQEWRKAPTPPGR